MSLTITKTAKTYPRLPYEEMKNAVLGKKYEVSLVFIGERRAHQLNKTYRQKTYIPNVLSFPLDTHTGEIFITPSVAQRECKKFDLSPHGYIGYLFIHGLLHLKGYPHGDTMERAEKKYLSKFALK